MLFGVQMHSSRWVQFFPIDGKVKCPNDHVVPLEKVYGEAQGITCLAKGRDGHSNCKANVYVAGQVWRLGGKPVLLACEIEESELYYIRNSKLSYNDILEYLGIM